MNLPQQIEHLKNLGEYILSDDPVWLDVKEKASIHNPWFIPQFIDVAMENIARYFLEEEELKIWVGANSIPHANANAKLVGIVMAGNIPAVGFHDLLCVLVSGHKAKVKISSKDDILIPHLIKKLQSYEAAYYERIVQADMLKDCDAYIATGSNNSSRYFDSYFAKYPHIIRRNRTSVAYLQGNETENQLNDLADDIFLYFGRGCRNVTMLHVPEGYNFEPLINALRKYDYLSDHQKYKNNYDYNLAVALLNGQAYMSTDALILLEHTSIFSPLGVLHYTYYSKEVLNDKVNKNASFVPLLNETEDMQCIVGADFVPFGQSQLPTLSDYADGVNTLHFLRDL